MYLQKILLNIFGKEHTVGKALMLIAYQLIF